ncbi:MAG: hypothetical protein ACJA08_002659 [Cyclobacteriaceae bacterium]|jgi:hypothetical protein
MKSKIKFKIPILLFSLGSLGTVGVIFSVFTATRYQELDIPYLGLAGSLLMLFLTIYLTTNSFGKLFRELVTLELNERELRVFYILTLKTKVIPWNELTGYHISAIITGKYRTKMIEVFTLHVQTDERIDIVQYYHKNYSELVNEIKKHTNNYLGYQPYKQGIFGRRYTNEYQQ